MFRTDCGPRSATRRGLVLAWACTFATGCTEKVLQVNPDASLLDATASTPERSNLQRALDGLVGPARVVLRPGQYFLAPSPYEDPTCGNCEDAATAVDASVGMVLTGQGITVTGISRDNVIIHTHAGYGILVEDCENCLLESVTITGGIRDADGRATDAAVVVRRSSLTLADCVIRDNIGDSATVSEVVVGIMGVTGREDSDFEVRNCRIERNSWDGIALYRGATARIRDNVIDGVDKAAGGRVGGGRGVGIGLTWDAEAVVERNLVRRYWKGIGIFVNADATVRHNIVEDVLTWGIAYWAAGYGRPVAFIEENVVYQSGACGAMLDRDSTGAVPPGAFRDNAIVRATQNERYDSGEPYCLQRPLARVAIPDGFIIENNLFHDSRQPGDAPREEQVSQSELLDAIRPLVIHLKSGAALRESTFLREFIER